MQTSGRLARTLQSGLAILAAAALAGCSTEVAGTPIAAATGPAPSTSHAPGTPTTGPSGSVTPPPPTVPGWQVVVADKPGIAYDVPPDWKVETPDTIIGFSDNQGNPLVGMNDAALYKSGYCPGQSGSSRGGTGVNSTTTTDPGQAATETAQKWSTAAYTTASNVPPTVTAGTPAPITVAGDSGMVVTDTMTVSSSTSCDPPTALITVVALPLQNNGGCALFILYADQGTPDSASSQEIQQIISSLRAD